jgi:hypothetical protein
MENLIHNVSGELASLYVNYLAQRTPNQTHEYFKKMWKSEYQSRMNQIRNNPELVHELNGYNPFYKVTLNQTGGKKRNFLFQ